ncbi:NAD(P)/FAD-dependent oxidoreductase [Kaistia sp. UC242_56]|uniref:NAD(P)/FAD-dependent oxidoreductase n=1 Tax=Kaistia sp. UC242_56 TaxID=3374625 RepID=UPI0037908D05
MKRAIVIGGGIVGLSLAVGMARTGLSVVILDGSDQEPRASYGNAGLVWVQGKGANHPPYAQWSRRSASLWPAFAAELLAATGIDPEYDRRGGFSLCLSDEELTSRVNMVARLSGQPDIPDDVVMVDPAFIRERLPKVGPDVIGGSWCPADGHANPLLLTQALAVQARGLGVEILRNERALSIGMAGSQLTVFCAENRYPAERVVVAAGLATQPLAATAGMRVPLKPVRGQIVVTERLPPLIAHATPTTRQARAGSVMFGNSHEDHVVTPGTTLPILASHAQRAIREFPFLASARVLRSWGAIRVMPADGMPIYARSETCPGAFAVACHSGITLAAAHAEIVGPAIAADALPAELVTLSSRRFDAALAP